MEKKRAARGLAGETAGDALNRDLLRMAFGRFHHVGLGMCNANAAMFQSHHAMFSHSMPPPRLIGTRDFE
jgi:hypothetical protein